MPLIKIAISVFIIFILFLLGISFFGFYSAIKPSKFITTITPENLGLSYQDIQFRTRDNIVIKGWYIPSAASHAKTIILLHGYPMDKGDILPSRAFLHYKYNLLFLDFRYLGQSGGRFSTIGKNEVLDVLAAINYLKQRGINEVGIWGLSMGAAVALMTAPNAPEVKAIIAESSYASLDKMAEGYFKIPILRYPLGKLLRFWGWLILGYDIKSVSPLNSAKKLSIPILIIHSKADRVISFDQAILFKTELINKPSVQFIFFDNLAHGQTSSNYKSLVESFFNKNL